MAQPIAEAISTVDHQTAGEPFRIGIRIGLLLVFGPSSAKIKQAQLPDSVIEDGLSILRHPLEGQEATEVGRLHQRLERAVENVSKQHLWGDLTDIDYRRQRRELEAQLAAMPGDASRASRLKRFATHRELLLTAAKNLEVGIATASPRERQESVALLVKRVLAKGRQVVRIDWTPPAEPFFAHVRLGPAPSVDDQTATMTASPAPSRPSQTMRPLRVAGGLHGVLRQSW